jgi:hypothetical protein
VAAIPAGFVGLKLWFETRAELVLFALAHGLIDPRGEHWTSAAGGGNP